MKVIGITGAAGSGKDTACKFALEWCEENGFEAARVALADPLKVSAARALGFQGASALGSPEETAECVAFCNEVKQPDVRIDVALYIPPNCGPDPEPPEYRPIAELSGRQFLQFYGTEAHRDVFGDGFWTDVTTDILRKHERLGVDVVFITDVRFENEAHMVYSEDDWHGEVWSIQRPLDKAVEAHSSEEPLSPELLSLMVVNSGSLEDLRDAIRLSCEKEKEAFSE